MCALVPGWVTATVRVTLLIDCSDTARSLTLGNNADSTCTSMRRCTLCLRPVRLRLTFSSGTNQLKHVTNINSFIHYFYLRSLKIRTNIFVRKNNKKYLRVVRVGRVPGCERAITRERGQISGIYNFGTERHTDRHIEVHIEVVPT